MLSITCFESLIKLAICFLLENCGTVRNLRIQQVLPGGTGSVELRQCDSFESLDTKSKICDSRMLFIVLNQWGVLPFITYVSYRGTCFYIALVFLKRSIGRLLGMPAILWCKSTIRRELPEARAAIVLVRVLYCGGGSRKARWNLVCVLSRSSFPW
jgi:hypothetical protein